MKIDEIYINEAKRIRKKYLYNILYIVEKEEEVKKILKVVEDIKNEINDKEDINEDFYIDRITEMSNNILIIEKYLKPYQEEIVKLDSDQKTLYFNIRDKYPILTDDQIQEQIVPHIIPIDEEFRKNNQYFYKKLMDR